MTKLLTQCPLITWAKFNYHRHQCHLWPISPLTVPLSNIGGSRSTNSRHVCKCVQKSWPLTTLSAKKQQNEIWHPNKNGLIWLSTYQAKLSCDPKLWPMWPLPTIDLRLAFSTVTQNHKTAHTAFPNELNQISILRTSMAPSTTFHESHSNSQI